MLRLLTILLLLTSPVAAQQRIDPVWHYHYYPNAYAAMDSATAGNTNTTTNPRSERYASTTGGVDTLKWNVTGTSNAGHICGTSKMYTPTQWLTGVPRMHGKGYTGSGVKICFIGEGYSNDTPHLSISVVHSFDPSYLLDSIGHRSFLHDAQAISVMAANTDAAKIIGTAYGATYYSVAYSLIDASSLQAAMVYTKNAGCRIAVISSVIDSSMATSGVVTAFRNFYNNGRGITIMAAGTGASLGQMQYGCCLPGVVCVGSTVGGSVLSFTDSCYHCKIQARNGAVIGPVLPHFTIGASADNSRADGTCPFGTGHNNLYGAIGGQSYTAPDFAGMLAIVAQKFPSLSMRACYLLTKYFGRSISIYSTATWVPSLSFIR